MAVAAGDTPTLNAQKMTAQSLDGGWQRQSFNGNDAAVDPWLATFHGALVMKKALVTRVSVVSLHTAGTNTVVVY
ncbi:hypothetical protein ACFSF3_25950 [Vibrio chagasii]